MINKIHHPAGIRKLEDIEVMEGHYTLELFTREDGAMPFWAVLFNGKMLPGQCFTGMENDVEGAPRYIVHLHGCLSYETKKGETK